MGIITTKDLSYDRLHDVLNYNKKTGIWTEKIRRKGVKIGGIIGCVNQLGYRVISIDQKRYQSSRLAFLYIEGYFPENDIDHINRIKDDDRWENLRHVSHQCNVRNSGEFKTNTSGIKGVYWKKDKKKWSGGIKINGKSLHLGYFNSKIDAAKARWEAEKKYNFPDCNTISSAYLYLKKAAA